MDKVKLSILVVALFLTAILAGCTSQAQPKELPNEFECPNGDIVNRAELCEELGLNKPIVKKIASETVEKPKSAEGMKEIAPPAPEKSTEKAAEKPRTIGIEERLRELNDLFDLPGSVEYMNENFKDIELLKTDEKGVGFGPMEFYYSEKADSTFITSPKFNILVGMCRGKKEKPEMESCRFVAYDVVPKDIYRHIAE